MPPPQTDKEARPKPPNTAAGIVLLVVLAVAGAVLLATGCGGDDDPSVGGEPSSGAVSGGHVHGLAMAPGGDGVFIATHNGLYRAAGDGRAPVQVSAEQQDFMGFTVAAPDRLLASGHPAPGQDLPGALGLIESRDGGRTWQPVSLLGEADFHVLRAAGERVYGFDGISRRFLASADGGGTWQERELPAPMFVDLAIAPDDPERLVAATQDGLFTSNDAGRSWRPAGEAFGLLGWAPSGRLFVVDARAQILSGAPDGPLSPRGALPELPVTFMAAEGALYAALGDGRVLRSQDDGASWTAIAQV
ncbi:MAG: hypothetical protein M3370_01435 [Actinomycetota bacterium]|nr:hypothetical protein [Actinomycetota bacterium]